MGRIRALCAFQVLAFPDFPHHRGLAEDARSTLAALGLVIPEGVKVPPREDLDGYLEWLEWKVQDLADAAVAASEE